ncbi:precorrin-6A synthase (deacetylating) [Sinorhizobium sp. BG8]|uniref:precorrin-6A synthase (deacetylating) n=1 Tax=Sinorhizobium sp. BG8 TaxID=2613773 RepID=UPI00193D42C0|nr:precorrin-6A synthase (deacetylating) [Sinorhizobium sp. BG8]QRM53566.1 precorrin-6A synthase (deacetylating) [Sinorhizobium sp. BG8]
MRKLLVVGIGAGNPEHVTIQAINALNRADVLLIPVKGEEKAFLADLRRDICERYVSNPSSRIVEYAVPRRRSDGSYEGGVHDWHHAIAAIYENLLLTEVAENQIVALLVWGDPSLYDSTLRIVEHVRARGSVEFGIEVIPGITSIQALCASHAIPLNRIGLPVEITTGRRLAQEWPPGVDDIIVMLDGVEAYRTVESDDAEIYWGAYVGTPLEITLSGKIGEVREQIVETRRRAREANGWIMDTYLIRRNSSPEEGSGEQ